MRYSVLIISILISLSCYASEDLYILNDICTGNFYKESELYFEGQKEISLKREIRGITLSFEIQNPMNEYKTLSPSTCSKLKKIGYFLAKIKNPVIIEVHTDKIPQELKRMRNWEFSTVIANNIETVLLEQVPISRLYTVGFGEFMPDENNTPNNGSKNKGRVDIIILCSIYGE